MRIGIVGPDERGSVLAELWARAGHQVALGCPRPPDALEDLGPSVRVTGVDEAARFGEIVVLVGPFGLPELLPSGAAVAGKIVVDAMNAVTDAGEPLDLHGRASSALVAELFPDAYLVKAFNTIDADTLRVESRTSVPREHRFVIFLAGDESRANARISTLIEEVGFTPIGTGSLARGGRFQQPGSKIFRRPLLPADARRVLQTMR